MLMTNNTSQARSSEHGSAGEYCFGVLALGDQYRFHARELLNDLEIFAPHASVIVLTDHPAEFTSHPNAQVRLFRPRGVLRYYHDKRFVLHEVLSTESSEKTCIVLDANTRVLKPLPSTLDIADGISAFVTLSLDTEFAEQASTEQAVGRRRFVSLAKCRKIVYDAARQIDVNPSDVTFLHEYMYAVTAGREKLSSFLLVWDYLAKYMDYHGLAWSEGYAIGLAAAKVGLPVRAHAFLDPSSFYKYRLQGTAIDRGQKADDQMLLVHREQTLLRQYARFSPWPRRWQQRVQKLKMGARWLGFRCTGRRFRDLSGFRANGAGAQQVS